MPSALLKQSKGLRFLTLRRRGLPLSEIVPAAGLADAREFCGSENRAGRSLATAEARYSHSLIHAVSPQAAARIYYKGICDSPSRAVRRRPTAADCNSLYARLRPPPSANSPLPKPIILKKTQITTKKARKLLYDTIICTTFGTSDPSKYDVNRVAVSVNVENLHSDGNKRSPVGSLPRLDW